MKEFPCKNGQVFKSSPTSEEKAIAAIKKMPQINGKRIIQPIQNLCGYGV